ncbi:MAG TPA: oligosaccharide flippase family protein [Steroidobacteraceae bacterium]|nr:oligosaccharide flippase family protein [Steroidobacteraceae bacterium]
MFGKINLKGDLFASLVTFAGVAIARFGSSLILTRILVPEAYGIITILMSVSFTVSMLSDVGTFPAIVRAPKGDDPDYLNTVWTIRFMRAVFNAAVMYLSAPLVAHIFATPVLRAPLQVLALWFLIDGLESNAFPLAARRRNTRIVVYSDLAATILSTAFTIAYCYVTRTFWGMLYGVLLNRALYVSFSYLFYRDSRPRFRFDRVAAREVFQFTRYVMPSSMLTLVLTQFDKAVFLRFFDLRLLGIYGVANNITGQTESLISRTSEMVIYPRCAHNFRENPGTFARSYYTENIRVFAVTAGMVAAIGGAAHLIIAVLYDPRYAQAGDVLQALMLRAAIACIANPAENMLMAASGSKVILVGSILRAISLVCASVVGFYVGGFVGFIYGMSLSALVPLFYYFSRQLKLGVPVIRYESYRILYMACVALAAFLSCRLLVAVFHVSRIRI